MKAQRYDLIVKAEKKVLCFEPWRFQPKVERMIELIGCFGRFGYTTVIVDWRGLFPWSEERFRSRFAYPEHGIVEAYKEASAGNITLLTRLPCGSGMGNFLSHPGYRYLRNHPSDPETIRAGSQGAAKFVYDLLGDIVALIPDLAGIYIDPLPRQTVDQRYLEDLLGSIFPGLFDLTRGFAVIAAPYLSKWFLEEKRCTVLQAPPDIFFGADHTAIPPSLELYLHEMPCAGAVAEDRRALEHSKTLKAECISVSKKIDECWRIIRMASEDSYLPAMLGCTPEMSRAILERYADEVKTLLEECERQFAEVSRLFGPFLLPGILDRWIESRIRPVDEQIGRIREKARMVEVWIRRQ